MSLASYQAALPRDLCYYTIDMQIILILIVSYLLGSIPFGYIMGKLYDKDITQSGSGNIGATNIFRLLGPTAGGIVFALDLLKGTAAVLLSFKLTNSPIIIIGAGAGAILGHTFSVFMKFKGGRGVAVGLGVLLGIAPDIFLISLLWAIAIIAITRYVSVASITGSVLATFLMFTANKPMPFCLLVLSAAILIIYKHRPNLRRLLAGTEGKIGK